MTPKPIRLRAAEVVERRRFCPEREGGCAASLTSTDFAAGYCTNCGRLLTTNKENHDHDDDANQTGR